MADNQDGMEGETEHEGTYTQRSEPLTPVDTQAEGSGGGGDDDDSNTCPPAIHVTEEGDTNQLEDDADSGSSVGGTAAARVVDKELDACGLGDAEASSSPSQADPREEDDEAGVPLSDGPPLETHTNPTQPSSPPPPLSSHPTGIQNRSSEPCWYCLRSLEPEHRPQDPEQQLDVVVLQQDYNSVVPVPPGGQKVNYQTDPRPHFGVACSSRSTALPLWGSEGPNWVLRNPDLADQTHTCPHCHIGLPPDTLRWHEAKCLHFDGLKTIVNN